MSIRSRRSSFLMRLVEIMRTLILFFTMLYIYEVATATKSSFMPLLQRLYFFPYYELHLSYFNVVVPLARLYNKV